MIPQSCKQETEKVKGGKRENVVKASVNYRSTVQDH